MKFKSYLNKNAIMAVRLLEPQEKVVANIAEMSSSNMQKEGSY